MLAASPGPSPLRTAADEAGQEYGLAGHARAVEGEARDLTQEHPEVDRAGDD